MNNLILELTRIVQEVALANSTSEQVKLIVDSISQVIGVDACNLYLANEYGEMVLLASHGLVSTDNVKIPAGKGLVGLVARSRHAINIDDASSHPDYYYVAKTGEERFRSFCGEPLVLFGKVIGVLVVQRVVAQKLSEENRSFLVTLASQLALIVADISTSIYKPSSINLHSVGIKGAPGIGIGIVQLCENDELNKVPDAECDDIEGTIKQWHNLLAAVRADIKADQAALGVQISESVAGIFNAYQMLLSDQSLIEKVETEIRAGHWLPGALRRAILYFSELFRAMDDPYLKARHEDIQHLGNKLFDSWRDVNSAAKKTKEVSKEPVILVGVQIGISEILSIPVEQLAGIVCFKGSSLSHTAVLANALGIPAVMGVGGIKGLQVGERLIVDGNVGQVIFRPSDVVVSEFRQLINQERLFLDQLESLRDKPAITTDGITVKLFANTGLLADITSGLNSGAEGTGLYRTEIPFMVRESFPTEDEQVKVYQQVFAAYPGKPVYMRTLDIGADKQLPYFPISNEENPALGWRGIRFTLDNIQLLMTQVRAMIRAAEGADNLHIILPMISSTNELDTFRQLLEDACLQLRQEGLVLCRPKMGVMVEVPAAISQLPFWRHKIDFVSIGSNDLSQYLLALDRNNAHVATRYDHIHPAVLHEIYRIVSIAKQYNLPLSLCGEMASDPVAVVLLLGMGVRNLSMSTVKLPQIKWLIRSISIAMAEDLLAQALRIDSVETIRTMVNKSLMGISKTPKSKP